MLCFLFALVAACGAGAFGTIPGPLAALSDSSAYARFAAAGSLDLQGQAFLTSRAGDVKVAAGRPVSLDPATTTALRWFRRFGANPARIEAGASDPGFTAARRLTTADTDGRFRFSRLQPGDYLLRSVVTWQAEGDSVVHGGVVAALVTVEENTYNEVILSRLITQDSAAAVGIRVVSDSALAARPHRVIGRVTGDWCGTDDETLAREDLFYRAGKKGADAVARVSCRQRGVKLTRGCLRRIECVGDAIAWM